MSPMLNDLRIGLRLLRKDKTFTLAGAFTLAICIAANVVLFSIVDHVLLRPLPWPNADRIVLMANQYPGAGVSVSSNSGVPDYYDRLRETTVFESQAMYNWDTVSIDQSGSPARVLIMSVTPSFFSVLGVTAALGRTFTDAEGEVGSEHQVVLSDDLWQTAFGGDPGVIGRDVRLDDRSYTIVGVMPRTFSFLDDEEKVRLWRPLAFSAARRSDENRHSNGWRNIAKLKADTTVEQAQQQIDALNARNLERFPQYKGLLINARFQTTVEPLQANVVRDVRPTLYLLWGGALFVLLIGAVNVANLVLVRTAARQRELVTRLALGAARWRIARQLVTEHVVLTAISAAAGLFVGFVALRLLATLSLLDLPRAGEIRIDTLVHVYTMALAAMMGVMLGLIPLSQTFRANVAEVLTDQTRTSAGGRGARLMRRAFVVLQVAFAFVLLVGAGLLLASFRHLLAVDPGFRIDNVLTADVTLPESRYKDDQSLVTFMNDALLRLRGLPGVAGAGITDSIPFGSWHNDSVILAEGYQMRPGESLISPNQVVVSPGFFEAMGVRLLRGRFFDSRDGTNGPKTVIVDEKLAQRFWPNQDPIGRRMYQPTDINNLLATNEKTVFLTVVGVVHDLKLVNLVEGNGEVGAYFYPADQNPRRGLTLAIKVEGDPNSLVSSVRTVIGALDRQLPVSGVQTMATRMDRSLASRRSSMLLSITFGAVALLLSAIGVYGVLAYLVAQRTKEIGIRLALGSSPSAVFQLVLHEGMVLVGIGFVVGAVGILALKRSLDSLLFGISAVDPIVMAVVTTTLAVVAVLAAALPAGRATRIDPRVALAD